MQSGILPRGRYKNKPQLVLRSSFPLAGVVYCLSLVCPVCFVFVSFRSQHIYILAIVNNVALSIMIQVSFLINGF